MAGLGWAGLAGLGWVGLAGLVAGVGSGGWWLVGGGWWLGMAGGPSGLLIGFDTYIRTL